MCIAGKCVYAYMPVFVNMNILPHCRNVQLSMWHVQEIDFSKDIYFCMIQNRAMNIWHQHHWNYCPQASWENSTGHSLVFCYSNWQKCPFRTQLMCMTSWTLNQTFHYRNGMHAQNYIQASIFRLDFGRNSSFLPKTKHHTCTALNGWWMHAFILLLLLHFVLHLFLFCQLYSPYYLTICLLYMYVAGIFLKTYTKTYFQLYKPLYRWFNSNNQCVTQYAACVPRVGGKIKTTDEKQGNLITFSTVPILQPAAPKLRPIAIPTPLTDHPLNFTACCCISHHQHGCTQLFAASPWLIHARWWTHWWMFTRQKCVKYWCEWVIY